MKKKNGKSQFGRDYVARAEYLAGAPTPTPSKKGMIKKLESKHKGRRDKSDGSYHLVPVKPGTDTWILLFLTYLSGIAINYKVR